MLVVFFCIFEGCKDIGYLGNVFIVGDYLGFLDEVKVYLD